MNTETETKLPEGLQLAVDLLDDTRAREFIKFGSAVEDEILGAIDAVRAEHTQRLTLQHHAADMAQRVADLEAERNKLAHEHHLVRADAQARVDAAVIRALAAERERDELRARLAEMEGQAAEIGRLRASLTKARDGLSCGLWDYGPGQSEHDQCNELISEIDGILWCQQ
jgi:signal transduction histidine kinase